jgi:CBS-domain-containing membrane protein
MNAMKSFFDRMKTKGECSPRKPLPQIVWSWLGALVGIYVIGTCGPYVARWCGLDGAYVIGSFGAAAVLIYGAPMAEFSQPRNLLLGNVLSAIAGVTAAMLLPEKHQAALAGAIAVSSAVLLMHLTRSLHPPGGATALIAVIGGDAIRELGYLYAVFPVLLGSMILLVVALVVNNLSSHPARHYPTYWF